MLCKIAMDKSLYFQYAIVIIFLLNYCSCILVDDDEDDSPWNRCPWIRNKLKNGRVKIRNRGRIAKFLCDPGYELAGKRFSTCIRGQWNNPIPMCVARGCFNLPEVPNGRITEMYRGAVVMYDCLPGYIMEGPSTLYCDGRHWTSVVPTCAVAITDPPTSCDFEDPDLCGWIQDPTHDFDWKRNQYSTPSGHSGTGPSYDHTYGVNKGGFYLYLEASSPRKENDICRLFSPVYHQDQSEGCFLFWYHMYGSTIGSLKIFLKPESHVFGELSPAWELSGDQGNSWIRANLTIPKFMENFQIVIEGIRGSNYIGDIAIDDVYLTSTPCDDVVNITENVTEFISNSCRGRCREANIQSYCGCNDNCHANGNCCFDFFRICTGNYDPSENENHLEEQETTIPPSSSYVFSDSNVTNLYSTFISSNEEHVSITSSDIVNFTTNLSTSKIIPIETDQKKSSVIDQKETDAHSSSITTLSTFKIPPSASITISSTTFSVTTPYTTTITASTTTSAEATTSSTTTIPITKATTTNTPSTSTIIPSTTTSSTSDSIQDVFSTISFTSATSQSTTTSPYSPTTTSTIPHTTSTTVVTTEIIPPSISETSELPKADNTTFTDYRTQSTTLTSVKISETSKTLPTSSIAPSSSSVLLNNSVTSSSSTTTSIPTTSTRKTYNLRPRNRTTRLPYIPTIFTFRPRYSTLTIPISFYTTQRSTPLTITSSTTSMRPEIRPRTSWYSFTTADNQKYRLQTTTEPSSSFKFKISTSKALLSNSDDTHASKSASTAADNRQSTVIVVTIIIVIIICIVGGGAYFMKKRSEKRQSKLSDDSEMRFLSENEIVDYSDSTALDKMFLH